MTAEFKARVAFEAIRGERAISQLATKHQLHPNQITQWKRQAIGLAILPLVRATCGPTVQRARYMTLESVGQLSDDPLISLPAVAR